MTTTQQVQVTLNGSNVPINVTVANLSPDLNLKDFVVVVSGAIVPNSNYTKSSTSTILYSGPALTAQNTVIRRRTPAEQMHTVDYSKRVSSQDWSDEVDRLYRRVVEVELFGYNYLGGFVGAGNSVVNDQAFGVDWATDTTGVASRKTLYSKITAMDGATAALTTTVNNIQSSTNSNTTTINSLTSSVSSITFNQTALQNTQTAQNTRLNTLENQNLNDTLLLTRRTVAQSLTASQLTTIIFNNELIDAGNFCDPATGRITVSQTGVYELVFSGYVTASSVITQPSLAWLVVVSTNLNYEFFGFATIAGVDASFNTVVQATLTAGVEYVVRLNINATTPILQSARLLLRRID